MRADWKNTAATVWSFIPGSAIVPGSMNRVIIQYQVDGEQYSSEMCTFKQYVTGQRFQLKYDANRPEWNELARRDRAMRWVGIVFFTLLGILAVYLFMQPKVK